MAYSKSEAAKELGISKKELENRAKDAGFNTTEDYYNAIGGAAGYMKQQVIDEIIRLDRQLAEIPGIHLTDEEIENFLNKAVEQVQPYYDRKISEIEAGIKEGKIRTAEDTLLYTRDVLNEVQATLSDLDLAQAETEDEFLDKIANITARKDEDVSVKRESWRIKMEGLKFDQIRSGIFASGVGKQKREEIEKLKQMEIGQTEAEAQRGITTAEMGKKYTIDQISLAREAAERDRAARIGAPATEQALGTLGLQDISQLGPKTAVEQARMAPGRNISTYKPEALTNLEEERLKAVESRKLELQQQEKTLREQELERQRQKILAQRASAATRLSAYGG